MASLKKTETFLLIHKILSFKKTLYFLFHALSFTCFVVVRQGLDEAFINAETLTMIQTFDGADKIIVVIVIPL